VGITEQGEITVAYSIKDLNVVTSPQAQYVEQVMSLGFADTDGAIGDLRGWNIAAVHGLVPPEIRAC